jgi:trk system potassium uptake protein TrkH
MIGLSGIVGLAYNDSHHNTFFLIALCVATFAVMIKNMTKPKTGVHLNTKQGFLITLITWGGLGLVGALPFYFTFHNISFIDCLFESISGITTTGATVFEGLEYLDKSIQFWRMLLPWFGGMGILVLAVAVLPFLGVGGMKLFKSELPGVTKDKLHPRIADTAKILWVLYVALTMFIAFCYYICGMNLFDAITHSFTTISTSGFSNYDASFAYFNSSAIEWVTIFLMLICGMNFALHYLFITGKLHISSYLKNEELRFYLKTICIAIFIILVVRIIHLETLIDPIGELRKIMFHVVSIITTTGYVVSDYEQWHEVSAMMMFILMFIGGCSGSTSGSVKALRIMIALKQGKRELRKLITENLVYYIKLDGKKVDVDITKSVLGFIGLFFFTFAVVCVILSILGLDFKTAISAAASTITNTGPGLGLVGPAQNMAHLSDAAKLVLSASMLIGRLEVLTVLVIFMPVFWKK